MGWIRVDARGFEPPDSSSPRASTVASDPTAGRAGEDVFLVRIDAKGEDEAVLRGAHALLERCQPVVIVETWGGGNPVRQLLANQGYRVYRYEPVARRLVEFSPDWSGQANFIACRPLGRRR